MSDQRNSNIASSLYHAMEKYVVLDTISAEKKAEIIQKAMENRAVQTLEAIRRALDDDTYDDPECFYRVDELVMLFFRELEVKINRHNECE